MALRLYSSFGPEGLSGCFLKLGVLFGVDVHMIRSRFFVGFVLGLLVGNPHDHAWVSGGGW